ncbi:MAG: T9SS type A sorting domain-containing protein [candidate division Zixibacteria bacterium]|nr:T9SS type A sorting domain-containing protein [candidate division Zixibacteria bacterium]
MRGIILIIVVLCWGIAVDSVASPGDMIWAKRHGGHGIEDARCIQETPEGDYLVTGYTTSLGNDDEDVFLIKLRSNGNYRWFRSWGGNEDDRAYKLIISDDNCYVLTGYSESYGAGGKDLFLLKLDRSGNTIWLKTYGGDRDDGGRDVMQTSDGGYIIAGWTDSFSHGDSSDVYLIKTDASGDSLWSRTYGTNWWDKAHTVRQTTDGGYIIAGITKSIPFRHIDIYIIKTDSTGGLEWNWIYGTRYWDEAYAIEQTDDGGYIFTGGLGNSSMFSMDTYLIKLTSEGNISWRALYGDIFGEYSWSLCRNYSGGYIIAGSRDVSFFNKDFNVICCNNAGDSLWGCSYGGDGWDRACFITRSSDGNYVLAGQTSSFDCVRSDIWVIKIEGEQPNPAVTINIVPENDPVVITPGGTFGYDMELINNTAIVQQVDVWTGFHSNAGEIYGPYFPIGQQLLSPYQRLMIPSITQFADPGIPLGQYSYHANCGIYNDDILFSSSILSIIINEPYEDPVDLLSENHGGGKLPEDYRTNQSVFGVYPNPFNASTVFRIPAGGDEPVVINIYDLAGRIVERIVDGSYVDEIYTAVWTPRDLPSGIYFYSVKSGQARFNGKLFLLK